MATGKIPKTYPTYVEINGTSGGSGAINLTSLSGIYAPTPILAVVDLDAGVGTALHLDLHISGSSWGATLLDRTGTIKPSTAFHFRLYYI